MAGLTALTELLVSVGDITAASIAILRFPGLAKLDVGRVEVQARDAARLTALTRLTLKSDSPGLHHLLPLPHLVELEVSGTERAGAASSARLVAAIARQPGLTRLAVDPRLLDEEWLEVPGEQQELRELRIGSAGACGADVYAAISELPSLQALTLQCVSSPGWQLAVLQQCPQLTALVLRFCDYSGEMTTGVLASMVCMPGMEFVGCHMCPGVDEGVLYALGCRMGVTVDAFHVNLAGLLRAMI
jgi:hypothetical protein